jgi:hypothetical protein
MSNFTPEQIEQDELILAAIIAGGMASGREVRPALFARRPSQAGHRNGFGVQLEDEPDGPCCAVGAGVLFSGVTEADDALRCFAVSHDVSYLYAQCVSSGFENDSWAQSPPMGHESESDDFARGLSVGSAAWDFFCGDDAP